MKEKRLIVILGPTAVGKTSLAIRLAKHLGTEIISADSRQIYRDLTIGTAKPSMAELGEVRHHMIDVRSVEESYDAGQYGRDALSLINRLFEKYNAIVLCGGSGLYIKSVCEGFDDIPEVTPGLRELIIAEYEEKGLAWLQDQLRETDPEYFAVVDQQNPHRLIRALELNRETGKKVGELRKKKRMEHPFSIVKVGLDLDRKELFARIDSRVDRMITDGLFEEAARLHSHKELNALQTVGYQEIFGFFDGFYDRGEAIRSLKRNSRRYAKRQLTWFKKDAEITWFNPEQGDEILEFVTSFAPAATEGPATGKKV